MSIDLIEFTWITINLVTFILTLVALVEARADQAAVRLLNGRARELAATGIVRREKVRLYVQFIFLAIATPSLFTEAPERTPVQYAIIVLLMSGALALLWNTVKDRQDRQVMTVLLAADVLNTRESSLERIEAKLDNNTAVTQEASQHAQEAYTEANHVNIKIADLNEALLAQGVDRAREVESQKAVIETIDATHDLVGDLHEGTAPQK